MAKLLAVAFCDYCGSEHNTLAGAEGCEWLCSVKASFLKRHNKLKVLGSVVKKYRTYEAMEKK